MEGKKIWKIVDNARYYLFCHINNDDQLDDAWPTNRFRNAVLLPDWYAPYLNRVGGNNMSENNPLLSVPDTGAWTSVVAAATVSRGTLFVVLSAFCVYIYIHKDKTNKATFMFTQISGFTRGRRQVNISNNKHYSAYIKRNMI